MGNFPGHHFSIADCKFPIGLGMPIGSLHFRGGLFVWPVMSSRSILGGYPGMGGDRGAVAVYLWA